MASKKLTAILRSKFRLTTDQIASMTETQGWAFVAGKSKSYSKTFKTFTVCFTGFSVPEKEQLCEAAIAAGIKAVTGVSKVLSLLCVGAEPGPSKVARAKEFGISIVTCEEFLEFLATGELPDPTPKGNS